MTTWTKGIPDAICCAHCGLTFDAHIAGSNRCPPETAHEKIRRLTAEAMRFRNMAHCTHESAEPMPTSPDDETVYVCPDCEYTWSESY